MKTRNLLKAALTLAVFAVSIFVAHAANDINSGITFATLINIGGLTWNGKEVMDMGGAVLEKAYQNPSLNQLHTVLNGIVAKQQIAYLGRLGKITKKDGGCNTSPTTQEITTDEKFWDPQPCSFWVSLCAKDLNASFFVWGQKNGINRRDLSGTEAAQFIMQRLEEALLEDALRNAWFSHKDAATVTDSPAGVLTTGTDADYYNIIDGFWAQIDDIVTATPAQLVAISRNAQASYANQAFAAADTTNKVATGILQDMYDAADDRLKEDPNAVYYVTGSVFEQYKKELKSYSALEAAWRMTQDGAKVLTFDGRDVIPVRQWDRVIKADFDNGTKYYRPHRAVLTTKENLQIGTDTEAAATSVTQYYLPKEKTNNWEGQYLFDVKVAQDFMLVAAF